MSEQEVYRCPVETLAIILGKKWIPQIIELLSEEKMRFGAIQKSLPNSSPKMIKQQLKILEENGIIINEKSVNHNTISSEYFLSSKGIELTKIVKEMKIWGERELTCD